MLIGKGPKGVVLSRGEGVEELSQVPQARAAGDDIPKLDDNVSGEVLRPPMTWLRRPSRQKVEPQEPSKVGDTTATDPEPPTTANVVPRAQT